MKILISGSGGFLGGAFSNFCKSKGYSVLEIKRKEYKAAADFSDTVFYSNSFLENDFVRQIQAFKPNIFVHFAWKGVDNTNRNQDQYRYNINLTLESIQLAKAVGCTRWIGFGSQAEYGLKSEAIVEETLCEPISDYGKSKLSLSISSMGLCDSLAIEGAWIRIFSIFGENDHSTALIPSVISKMLQNEDVNLTECTQTWDYLYLTDALEALEALMLNFKSGIYNLGSGNPVILKKVIELIQKKINSKSKLHYGNINFNENSVRFLLANINKLSQQTNWKPRFSIEQGIENTVMYHKNKMHLVSL
jgi:nucleoside-diphosphate-sugar epimerase